MNVVAIHLCMHAQTASLAARRHPSKTCPGRWCVAEILSHHYHHSPLLRSTQDGVKTAIESGIMPLRRLSPSPKLTPGFKQLGHLPVFRTPLGIRIVKVITDIVVLFDFKPQPSQGICCGVGAMLHLLHQLLVGVQVHAGGCILRNTSSRLGLTVWEVNPSEYGSLCTRMPAASMQYLSHVHTHKGARAHTHSLSLSLSLPPSLSPSSPNPLMPSPVCPPPVLPVSQPTQGPD
jgi:hypothetical protein